MGGNRDLYSLPQRETGEGAHEGEDCERGAGAHAGSGGAGAGRMQGVPQPRPSGEAASAADHGIYAGKFVPRGNCIKAGTVRGRAMTASAPPLTKNNCIFHRRIIPPKHRKEPGPEGPGSSAQNQSGTIRSGGRCSPSRRDPWWRL